MYVLLIDQKMWQEESQKKLQILWLNIIQICCLHWMYTNIIKCIIFGRRLDVVVAGNILDRERGCVSSANFALYQWVRSVIIVKNKSVINTLSLHVYCCNSFQLLHLHRFGIHEMNSKSNTLNRMQKQIHRHVYKYMSCELP